MRTRNLYATGLVALAAPLVLSCDSITTGQLEDDPGPPVLLKILVQDALPRNGRRMATDLLDKTAQIKCSDAEPCPAGEDYGHLPCTIEDGKTEGVCPDPLKADETPPPIDPLVGTQIRLIFSKGLDSNKLEDVTKNMMTGAITGWALKDPDLIALIGPDGLEVSSKKYWDPAGSPLNTSDLFIDPLGPALVIKPSILMPSSKYTIKLKTAGLVDKAGQAAAKDVNGAIAASYEFTTENIYPFAGPFADYGDTIDTNDAIALTLNTDIDPATLKVTVKKKDGTVVKTVATPDLGDDVDACADNENDQQINVFLVDANGMRAEWEEGDYTIDIEGLSAFNDKASLSIDSFGMEPFKSYAFSVVKGTDADYEAYLADNFLLPDECTSAQPDEDMAMAPQPDMSMTPQPDMTTLPDMTTPVDMAKPVDGANGG